MVARSATCPSHWRRRWFRDGRQLRRDRDRDSRRAETWSCLNTEGQHAEDGVDEIRFLSAVVPPGASPQRPLKFPIGDENGRGGPAPIGRRACGSCCRSSAGSARSRAPMRRRAEPVWRGFVAGLGARQAVCRPAADRSSHQLSAWPFQLLPCPTRHGRCSCDRVRTLRNCAFE